MVFLEKACGVELFELFKGPPHVRRLKFWQKILLMMVENYCLVYKIIGYWSMVI